MPAGVTILAVVATGAVLGAVIAFCVTQLKMSSFIATVAMQSIMRGFAFIISNGEGVLITNSTFLKMGNFKFFGLIMLNVQSFWQNVAKGALLLLALTFDYIRQKNRQKAK